MTALFKKAFILLALTLVSTLVSSSTFAAAPDGAGPWADSVASSSQGTMKNGAAVPAIRSNASSALGVAENNTTDGNFFSLGFGGNIALGFDNGISSGVIVVEATNPGYPSEKAKIEVSENGTTWVNAGQITQDGQVNKPESVNCAKFVRITDVSNKDDFSDDTADGYDVDGVQATGEPCTSTTPTPTPTPPPTGCSDGCCNTKITQTNVTAVKTVVKSTTNTGGNKVKDNTGGSNNITTGNATSNTTVTVTGGSNVANGGGCCGTGNTNISITGNGAGSHNSVNVGNSKNKAPAVKKK